MLVPLFSSVIMSILSSSSPSSFGYVLKSTKKLILERKKINILDKTCEFIRRYIKWIYQKKKEKNQDNR